MMWWEELKGIWRDGKHDWHFWFGVLYLFLGLMFFPAHTILDELFCLFDFTVAAWTMVRFWHNTANARALRRWERRGGRH